MMDLDIKEEGERPQLNYKKVQLTLALLVVIGVVGSALLEMYVF